MPNRWTVSKVTRVVSQEVGLGSSVASTPEILGAAFVATPVPPSSTAAVEVSSHRTERKVLEALEGRIEAVRRPPLYSVATFVVAVAMVMLPLFYLALIGLVSYGIYHHALENASILTSGALKLKLMVYLGPLVSGIVVVIFMIKPLFARSPQGPAVYSVDPRREPLLYNYVERLSRLVGAPLPRRIDLDCEVNASASFRRGYLSMFGNDLVLTIGLPLVADLDLRRLSGVLAHELGHFAQRGGMRLTYVIRSINHWFARVVFERDEWDQSLKALSDDTHPWMVQAVAYLSQGCVWLTRRLLWTLMMMGNAISCLLLRQMEFDADRYEVRVAGSEVFESTVLKLQGLGLAAQRAQHDLGGFWSESRLPDDFPKLIRENYRTFSKDALGRIRTGVLERRTGWWDTHPADKERIESARQEGTPGISHPEVPSSVLFSDFGLLSKEVSRHYYRNLLGLAAEEKKLVPTADLLRIQAQDRARDLALDRYFQGRLSHMHPLHSLEIPVEVVQDKEEIVWRLRQARKIMLNDPDKDSPAYSDVARKRLQQSLELLLDQSLTEPLRPQDPEVLWHEAKRMIGFLQRLQPVYSELPNLVSAIERVVSRLRGLEGNEDNEVLFDNLATHSGQLFDLVKKLTAVLGQIPYPFEHAEGSVSCGQVVAAPLLDGRDAVSIARAGGQICAEIHHLYSRVMAALAFIAEQVEAAVGLEPLPHPSGRDECE